MALKVLFDQLREDNTTHRGSIVLSFCTVLLLFLLPYVWPAKVPTLKERRISDEPPMLPYRIPFLGHSLSFLRNSEELFAYGRKLFKNTRQIFSIDLGGDIFYVLTNPQHVAAVHKNATSFPFDHFLKTVLMAFGTSEEGCDLLMREPDSSGRPAGLSKSVLHLAHDFQTEQTRGTELKPLAQHITSFVQDKLNVEYALGNPAPCSYTTYRGTKCISLKTLAFQNIIHGVQNAYFGSRLLEIDPGLPETLMEFDNLSWKAWFHYPWFMRRRLDYLGNRLRDSLQSYFRLPAEERGSRAWFTQKLEKEYRNAGLSEADITALMLFLHWGINTNPAKATPWIIAHILFEPDLVDIIREETAPAFRNDGTINTDYIAESCPRLISVWLEVLRLYASSTSVRYITQDTPVGEHILKKDRAVIFSARQLHIDNHVFGENTDEFDSLRFYENPNLERCTSFRPFGGGKTLCPGRHLARHVSLSFVAMLFRNFDVSLAFPQSFPRKIECKPAIGIIGGCDDLYLQLKPRASEEQR